MSAVTTTPTSPGQSHEDVHGPAMSHRQIMEALWGLLLTPGLVFLPLMGLTIASITGPLKRAETITSAISHGDLTHEINPKGRDEIARLMNDATGAAQGVKREVETVTGSYDDVLAKLNELADQALPACTDKKSAEEDTCREVR